MDYSNTTTNTSNKSNRYKIQQIKKYERLIDDQEKKTRKEFKGIGKAVVAAGVGLLFVAAIDVAPLVLPAMIAGGGGIAYKVGKALQGLKKKANLEEKLDELFEQMGHSRGGY
ncbi:MAG: hypothetical protein IKG58_04205 [Bacilli bacterium]|nr:hypothetical protein [Bacilli bacterium]